MVLILACAGAFAADVAPDVTVPPPASTSTTAPQSQAGAITSTAAVAAANSTTFVPLGTLVPVPAMTPLRLQLADPISSNASKPGDRFRLVVSEDVRVGDAVVIPAGTTGEGEVIHAAKSGAGGKPGELLLAGRFLRVGEQNVRLRSFVIGGAGRDRMDQALATSFVAGPFAMFVRGGVIVIPVGASGTAKTLESVQLPAVQPGTVETAVSPAEIEPTAQPPAEVAPAPAPEPQQPPTPGTGE
ncbi:MAG TPA: hypothetical protein VF277_03505 [Steroidobacteraceae bacterium]